MPTIQLSDRDVADLITCIDAAWSEGMGLVRIEVLRQLGKSESNDIIVERAKELSRQHAVLDAIWAAKGQLKTIGMILPEFRCEACRDLTSRERVAGAVGLADGSLAWVCLDCVEDERDCPHDERT